MQSFKDFLKDDDIPSVNVQPVHGAHAQKKAPSINTRPTHGAHAQPPKGKLDEAAAKPKESPYSWSLRHDNEHLGHTVDDVHNKINMHEKDFEEHPHSKNLYKYTQDSYETNGELVRRSKGDAPRPEHDEHIHALDTALSHTPTKHNMYVYHGTAKWNPADYMADKESKKIVHVPTYMSTSIDRDKAVLFSGMSGSAGRHVLRIKVPKGSKGMYLGDNSRHANEREFLLPRDQKLKFKSKKPTKVLQDYDGGKVHVWDAEIHHQPEVDNRQLSLPFKKKLPVQYHPDNVPTTPSRWNPGKK